MATTTDTTPTRNSPKDAINMANLKMRQQPWYQAWFKQNWLNPDNVHLNDDQRKQLEAVAAQNGMPLGPDGMNIDPAGNINTPHGFHSLPTWAKIAIGAAPIAAGVIATGGAGLPGMSGLFGSTTAPLSAASMTVPELPVSAIPSILGTGAAATTASTAAPSLMSRIAGMVKNPAQLLSAGGRAVGAMANASAANRGTTIDATMAHDQLQLEADQQRRAAEADAYRKSLYGQIAAGYQPAARPNGIPSGTPGGYVTPQSQAIGQGMTDSAVNTMQTQNYPHITPLSQLPLKPGLLERIAGYAAPALSMFDPRLYGNGTQPHA